MKAIHISNFVTDLTTLIPSHIPEPKLSHSKNICVKITHAAVTHVDLLYAQGLHQNNKRHVQPPFILGTEFSGVITQNTSSSPLSSSLEPGTRVFGAGLGAYAQSICVPEADVRIVPDQWTNAQACAVGASGAVSYGALISVAGLRAKETVLVLGASGGLGIMACQIGKAAGARVVAVVGSAEKGEVARGIGADVVVNFRDEGWEEEVRRLTGGEGVDVVFDAVGAVEAGIKCCKYRGRVVIVGFAARSGDMERVMANRILLKGIAVFGYRFGEDGRREPQRTKDIWDGFMKMVEEGKIRPVIYKEEYWGLEAVPRALENAKQHKTWGRAVLRIDEDPEKTIQRGESKL